MTPKKLQLLAASKDPTISQVLQEIDPEQWSVVLFDTPERIFSAQVTHPNFLLLDESVTGSNYLSLIKRVRKRFPAVDIMVVGGPKSDDLRISEKRDGVDGYFERPLEPVPLKAAVDHRLALARLKAEAEIVGRSPVMEEIFEVILQVAPTEVPILIEGESGTGKDVIAQAVHNASRRRDGPFIAINCASLAEGVLESELFGHEKGAFTGAVSQRAGVFEQAHRGTIFLDEVADMSPNMQVRLLRVLESGEVLRVGGVKSFKVDVRVIAATNRTLSAAVAQGSFRQDLYYRLKGVSFYLPPLRERSEDIPLMVDYFIRRANAVHHKDVKGIDRDAVKAIVDNPWPGNVRELRNLIDTAVVLSPGGRISLEVVGPRLADGQSPESSLLPVPLHRSKDEAEREMIYASILALHHDVREILAMLRRQQVGGPLDALSEVHSTGASAAAPVQNLAHLERSAIAGALRVSAGNRRRAADMLGISERTLYRKIKEYGLV
ncbi:MAG: sigma-54 dependent transcriptional regulator [Candidatus Krumholzibacteria bacterium]